jgi:hypothetical protein
MVKRPGTRESIDVDALTGGGERERERKSRERGITGKEEEECGWWWVVGDGG